MSVNGAAFYQIPRNTGKVRARLAGTPHHACDGMSRSVYHPLHPPNTHPAPRTSIEAWHVLRSYARRLQVRRCARWRARRD